MPVRLSHEHDDVYRLDVSGRLSSAELDTAGHTLTEGMRGAPGGTVRLLVVLRNFQGWDPASNWSNLTFYARHGDGIGRLALVGEERWRDLALMFSAAGLRKAEVEYFTQDALEKAREWLLQ
jgi:SpoIIAA-like